MDYETLIDDVIQQHKTANGSLWRCAEGVFSLYDRYGMYERDFTSILSAQLAVGLDTIYHWRRAWELRVLIDAGFPGFVLGGLSISHFYQAADYVDRMGVEWVYDFLVAARDSHWSSRRFLAEMATACDDSGTARWLSDKLGLALGRLQKLYGSAEQAGLAEHKRRRLRRVLLLLADVAK